MNELTEMVTYRLAELFSFCNGSSQVRSYLPYMPGGQGQDKLGIVRIGGQGAVLQEATLLQGSVMDITYNIHNQYRESTNVGKYLLYCNKKSIKYYTCN